MEKKNSSPEPTTYHKRYSAVIGIAFVMIGIVALFGNAILPIFGVNNWGLWRFWPVALLAMGAVGVAAPFVTQKRGLAGLFIPSVPVFTTGVILLIASLFNYWSIWEWAWPLELIALGVGFSLAAVGLRVRPLFIPAIIIGINGLLMLFCAITGWWEAWSILWTIEPLAVGFALLFTGFITENSGMRHAGSILCLIAGAGMALMTTVLASISLSFIGAVLMILLGGGLVVRGMLENRSSDMERLEEKMVGKEKLAADNW